MTKAFRMAFLGAMLVAAPSVVKAQDPGGGTCPTGSNIFTSFQVLSCSGWWSGNQLNTPGNATFDQALNYLLGTTGVDYPSWSTIDGTWASKKALGSGNIGEWGETLYGYTVIGIHWGGATGNPNNPGGSTAFFLIDVGDGTTWTQLGGDATKCGNKSVGTEYRCALSNAAVFYTSKPSTTQPGVVTPEPSTYLLVAAGLAGLGFVARRRRNAI